MNWNSPRKLFSSFALAAVVGGLTLHATPRAQGLEVADFSGFNDFIITFGPSVTAVPGAEAIDFFVPRFEPIGGGVAALMPPVTVDAAERLEITLKLGPNNTAETFTLNLSDLDGGGTGEGYLYRFNTADLNIDTFVTLTSPPLNNPDFGPFHIGLPDGDGQLNLDAQGGLRDVAVVSDPLSNGQDLSLLIQRIAITPEPGTASLLGLAVLGLVGRRTTPRFP